MEKMKIEKIESKGDEFLIKFKYISSGITDKFNISKCDLFRFLSNAEEQSAEEDNAITTKWRQRSFDPDYYRK